VSETCRVIINQVKQKLHLVGYLLVRYDKDARYHEHKKTTLYLKKFVMCLVSLPVYVKVNHLCSFSRGRSGWCRLGA